jgi:hypothetical protein
VSGEAEMLHVASKQSRSEVVELVTARAETTAVSAGAAADTLSTINVEALDIPYMAAETTRIRVTVVGDLDDPSKRAS